MSQIHELTKELNDKLPLHLSATVVEMTTKPELKPCPFCGKKPRKQPDPHFLWCSTKDCWIYSRSVHIDDWNRRVK